MCVVSAESLIIEPASWMHMFLGQSLYIQHIHSCAALPLARQLVEDMGEITTWDDCAGADMMFFVMKQLGIAARVAFLNTSTIIHSIAIILLQSRQYK